MKIKGKQKNILIIITVLISTSFLAVCSFLIMRSSDDWKAGDIYLKSEKQEKTSYEATFSYWDTEGKDIDFQYDEDKIVTFSYETNAKKGNLCFSIWKQEDNTNKELKEICNSTKGEFTVSMKANEKYVFNISGLKVKDGFVKVNWKVE